MTVIYHHLILSINRYLVTFWNHLLRVRSLFSDFPRIAPPLPVPDDMLQAISICVDQVVVEWIWMSQFLLGICLYLHQYSSPLFSDVLARNGLVVYRSCCLSRNNGMMLPNFSSVSMCGDNGQSLCILQMQPSLAPFALCPYVVHMIWSMWWLCAIGWKWGNWGIWLSASTTLMPVPIRICTSRVYLPPLQLGHPVASTLTPVWSLFPCVPSTAITLVDQLSNIASRQRNYAWRAFRPSGLLEVTGWNDNSVVHLDLICHCAFIRCNLFFQVIVSWAVKLNRPPR